MKNVFKGILLLGLIFYMSSCVKSQNIGYSGLYFVAKNYMKSPVFYIGTSQDSSAGRNWVRTYLSSHGGTTDTANLTTNGLFTKYQYKKLQDIRVRTFSGNVLVGVQAGINISTGQDNVMVGGNTGVNTTTENSNVYIGSAAGYLTNGSNNIFIGQGAGYRMTNKSNRLIINSMYHNTILKDTTYSIIYGIQYDNPLIQKLYINAKLYQNGELRDSANSTTSGFLTKFQYNKIQAGGTGQWTTSGTKIYYNTGNVGIGSATPVNKLRVVGGVSADSFKIGNVHKNLLWDAKLSATDTANTTTNGASTKFQYNKLQSVGTTIDGETNATSLTSKIGIGSGHSENEAVARYNVFFGHDAGYSNTTGNTNVFIGESAGYSNLTGIANVVIGTSAGVTSTASKNVFIGHSSGNLNETGTENTFVGYLAGTYNVSGSDDTTLGSQAGLNINTGSENTFIGDKSGQLGHADGGYNTAVGSVSGANVNGGYNTMIGAWSGKTISTGTGNITLGYLAGNGISSGSSNINIGYLAGYYLNKSGRLIINSYTTNNAAEDSTKSIIYGRMNAVAANQALTINAKETVNGAFNYGADAGSNDTYTATIGGITAYVEGLIIYFKANTANTGACSININSLGAINLKALHDQGPQDSYIEAGSMVHAIYDGTNFQMLQADANP